MTSPIRSGPTTRFGFRHGNTWVLPMTKGELVTVGPFIPVALFLGIVGGLEGWRGVLMMLAVGSFFMALQWTLWLRDAYELRARAGYLIGTSAVAGVVAGGLAQAVDSVL